MSKTICATYLVLLPLFSPHLMGSETIELTPRGRIQLQGQYLKAETPSESKSGSTLDFRRLRMGLDARLPHSFRARIDYNLPRTDKGNGSMQSAYVEWRKSKAVNLRAGLEKPFFGLEENTSSAVLLTIERSYITNSVAPGNLNGLTFFGENEFLTYGFGLYRNEWHGTSEIDRERYLHTVSLERSWESFALRFDFYHNDQKKDAFQQVFSLGLTSNLLDDLELRAEYIYGQDFFDKSTQGAYLMPIYHLSNDWELVFRGDYARAQEAEGLNPNTRSASRLSEVGDALKSGPGAKSYFGQYLGLNRYFSGHNNKLMFGLERGTFSRSEDRPLKFYSLYTAWRVNF